MTRYLELWQHRSICTLLLSAVCSLLFVALASGESLPLVDTPAGQAFKARHYDLALAEFQKLAVAQPRDALILRYLAMTLDRLGRYDDAIRVFEQALALTPENPALHFHMGTTYYKARRGALAEVSFRRVLQLAPDSLYGERARRYLEALTQQRVQLQPAGTPGPLELYIQGGLQYDSNIPAAPGDSSLFTGERSGIRMFEYLSGRYHLLRNPDWLGSMDVSTYQAEYPDSAFRRFRLSTYSAGASLQRTTTLWSLPLVASLKYELRAVLVDEDMYSRSHALTAGTQIGLTRGTTTHFHYQYTRDVFANKGFDRALSSRDADNHVLGLSQVWYFANRKGQVRAGYEFQDNVSEGVNFRMKGHKFSAGGTVPVGWGVQANLGAEYSHGRYPEFQGPVIRKTDRWGFNAGLSKWLGRFFLLRLDYAHTDEDSSYEILSYRRGILGVSISYVY